jgi:GNAT superfamily N-acetyltransferase
MTDMPRPAACTAEPRRIDRDEMPAAARVLYDAFRADFPNRRRLPGDASDLGFLRDTVWPACAVWGIDDAAGLCAVIAFREGWVDLLGVLPRARRQGHGGRLLRLAQARLPILSVRVSPCGPAASRFLEARGFVLTDSHPALDECVFRWRRAA